jgi:hypothetical protein
MPSRITQIKRKQNQYLRKIKPINLLAEIDKYSEWNGYNLTVLFMHVTFAGWSRVPYRMLCQYNVRRGIYERSVRPYDIPCEIGIILGIFIIFLKCRICARHWKKYIKGFFDGGNSLNVSVLHSCARNLIWIRPIPLYSLTVCCLLYTDDGRWIVLTTRHTQSSSVFDDASYQRYESYRISRRYIARCML